ncbi:MFS general substrate transporter [Martensiomyces pterosporus]|nr:MFS general substrate transporter [Martensiomyces pterosporus]
MGSSNSTHGHDNGHTHTLRPTAVTPVDEADALGTNSSHSTYSHSGDLESGFEGKTRLSEKQVVDSGSPSSSTSDTESPAESPKPFVDDQIVEYAPADSWYGWVIVACAAFNLMCTLGIVNSFGVFSTYYINYIYPTQSTANIAWIGTMVSTVMLGGSVATGPLTDRFGFRRTALVGTLICCAALIIASFTHTIWQLVLTQGIMFGIGAACIFSPSISLPAQWHDKYRPLATGIAVAGSGAGGMVFAEITQKLMDAMGYKWTLRVLALILLSTSGTASLFYKRRVSVPRGGIDFRAIVKDTRLVAVGMSGFFVNVSYFVPWYYLPTAAIKTGQTKQDANNLVLYMNASSTAGRIMAAYAAVAIGPINSITTAYLICAILIIVVMLAVKSMTAYIVMAVIYGGLSASCISITPLVLTNIFGTQAVATAMGIMNLWCSIGVLIGNPSQGAVYQQFDRPHDSFTAISIWGFVGLALAACSYIMLKVIVTRGTPHHIWSKL